MNIVYSDDTGRYSSKGRFSIVEDKGVATSLIASLERDYRRDFVTFFRQKNSMDLFQTSVPRFPDVGPFIVKDIPDPSKKFISLKEVGEDLENAFHGFVMANPKVRGVAGDKILFREDYESMMNKVRVISSGVGAWGDFVGRGMLTCMVLGTYGSPKPRVIYTALRELNKTADCGILAIIPNNYDDKLNWGIAIANAQNKGFQLDSFTFGDNAYEGCAVDERSCLAGIVICYKLAGGMSEEKYTLPVIADRLKIMFITTISCHFSETVRLGTDLEGKGGSDMKDVTRNELIKEMVSCLVDKNRKYSAGHDPDAEFVVLINSYFANWVLSQVVTLEVLQRIYERRQKCIRAYAGNLVQSVSAGFSVTVLPEGDDDIVRWLDSFTSCPGWLVTGTGSPCTYHVSTMPTMVKCKGTHFNSSQASMVREVIQLATANFKTAEDLLNTFDIHQVYGTNMCEISNFLLKGLELNTLLVEFPYILFTTIAESFEHIFNNIDGQMFALFSTSMGQYFGENKKSPKRITIKVWQKALQRSVKSVAGYFKIGYKDNTILDIFGSLYLIITTSRLDTLTDIHMALEVGKEQCWKAKYAKSKNIINSPYPTMKTALIILEAIATILREKEHDQLTANDIDTTPTLAAERIKGILTSS